MSQQILVKKTREIKKYKVLRKRGSKARNERAYYLWR